MHTHPTRYDYEAYKSWREQDEERMKEAIDAFHAREDARPTVHWKLALVGLLCGGALAALGFWWLITTVLDRIEL